MTRNAAWKTDLQKIINANRNHYTVNMEFPLLPLRTRATILFQCFAQLRALGFEPAPSHLRGAHVQALVDFWTANPAIAKLCAEHRVEMPKSPLDAVVIRLHLTVLRMFADWIGKPGMVMPAETYVRDIALVSTTAEAESNRGWTPNGIDSAEWRSIVQTWVRRRQEEFQ
jgi:hypothetical protein